MPRLHALATTTLALLAAPLFPASAQGRPAITPEVRPFVSVDAPVVALTHVRLIDGTGAPRATTRRSSSPGRA
ncbi:MAG: hypothetical protein IPJ56_17595 [Gemmatimonadetes bacterium]|nr:hypothetical protein [Gemmatimonadota bacterium]